jgi:hypothetical protein
MIGMSVSYATTPVFSLMGFHPAAFSFLGDESELANFSDLTEEKFSIHLLVLYFQVVAFNKEPSRFY